jgi:flagellar P-ring protein precursor FlgI
MAIVRSGVTLAELVDGLNALGIGPRDLIAILQHGRRRRVAGDIEVM